MRTVRELADTAARVAACEAVLERLRAAGIEELRLAWADVHGTLRGKTVVGGTEAFGQALRGGVGLVSTLLLKDTADRTAFQVFDPTANAATRALFAATGAGGFGAANNVQLLPDPASCTVLPWADATAWVRCDPLWADGSAVQADPRGVLLRALAALQQAGYGLRCGLEVEFHIHRITEENLAAADAAWPAEPPAVALLHPGYALLSEAHADRCAEALAIVRRTALGLGLPLRSLEIELGPSQFEAVFAPTDALTAADQMVLLRNGLRQALRRAGYHASFVCRPPLPMAVASGWHLHQSLTDADGRNAMRLEGAHPMVTDRSDARHTLSDAGAHWLAGLLAHAPGMTALCAPTIPAYSRYQGSVMAPQAVVWGRDNRGAMLRVIGAGCDTGGATGDLAARIENRIAEPMANPYLAIAAQVWAGLDGLQRRLDPGAATETPYGGSAARLPGSLLEALDALAGDAVLQRGLGPVMGLVYDTVKRQELARHAQAEDAGQWERREYFGRY
jgi:glutamine synthetase